MCDTFELAMMESEFGHNNNATKPAHRKSRRHAKHNEHCIADPAFSDMFIGVSELTSRDDGLTSQRSESEDRRSGAATSSSSSQRQRSRGSRSSGLGSSKKKSTTSGSAASITKRDSLQVGLAVADDDLFQRENTTLARQQLSSSASRTRPVKQQQQQQQQPKPTRSLRPSTRQVGTSLDRPGEATPADTYNNNSNNNDDTDEPIVEQAGGRAVGRAAPTGHRVRGQAEWETMYGVNQAGRLPSRSRRYMNYSAGSDGTLDPASTDDFPHVEVDEGDSPLGGLHGDRPPSRQCHAFPTHLLDPREFFSPTKHHDTSLGINITPWHAEVDDREEDEPVTNGPEEDSGGEVKQHTSDYTNQRPPSRYMVKPARGGSSSSNKSSSSPNEEGQGRLPSRRGAAGSRNQAAAHHYHDPKTDGFLDVDESVPPPFRVEISTEATRAQYVPSQHRRMDEERRHGLKSRRSSSFGSRSQLKNLQQQISYTPLERDGPLAREADAATRTRVVEPQWFQDLEPAANKRVQDAAPTARRGTVNRTSRSIVQPGTDNNTSDHAMHQWFRSMNNPFFVSPAVPPDAASASSFDDMDAETAIANTPLFSGEDDLMAMTQLTDLHLDDFMGDPYVYNSTSVGLGNASASAATVSVNALNGTGVKAASAALNTSLGRDFLSLFAQH